MDILTLKGMVFEFDVEDFWNLIKQSEPSAKSVALDFDKGIALIEILDE